MIEDEVEQHIPTLGQLMTTGNNKDVSMSVEPSEEKDLDEIADDIITEFSLNKKQKFASNVMKREGKEFISNVIKREGKEETQKITGFIGGPGGTGKSHIIKAIVAFHQKDQMQEINKIDCKYWYCSIIFRR